ncbi:MAG: HEPN domain-containing protein [Candidatus Margulisiibacteriota bacterium]|jgi:HEPN domain-containing protein
MGKILSEWLELAKIDLTSAEVLMNSPKHVSSVSIYLSHQAVEKSLKYLLSQYQEPILKTHDLMKLLSQLIKHVEALNGFIYDIQELDQYYPKLRYPTGDKFTNEEAKHCFEIASKIFDLIFELNNQTQISNIAI